MKHRDRLFFQQQLKYTTVRGVNIGVGHGPSKRAGKRTASVQALEYLRSGGKESKYEK
jgi:hypothetical protein